MRSVLPIAVIGPMLELFFSLISLD
jgi:hypothetical protein